MFHGRHELEVGKMRLSIDTYVLRSRYGDEKAIRMLKEAGFDGIDYSFV